MCVWKPIITLRPRTTRSSDMWTRHDHMLKCNHHPHSLIWMPYRSFRASLVAQMVKNLPAIQETWVQSLGWEDSLEEGMATHSSILAWRIPMEGYSPCGRKETDMTEQLSTGLILLFSLLLWLKFFKIKSSNRLYQEKHGNTNYFHLMLPSKTLILLYY